MSRRTFQLLLGIYASYFFASGAIHLCIRLSKVASDNREYWLEVFFSTVVLLFTERGVRSPSNTSWRQPDLIFDTLLFRSKKKEFIAMCETTLAHIIL